MCSKGLFADLNGKGMSSAFVLMCPLPLGVSSVPQALPTWFPWESRLLIQGQSASPVSNEIFVSLLTLIKRREELQVPILIFSLCFIISKVHQKACGLLAQMDLGLNSTMIFTAMRFWWELLKPEIACGWWWWSSDLGYWCPVLWLFQILFYFCARKIFIFPNWEWH